MNTLFPGTSSARCAALVATQLASATITTFTNDQAGWESAAGQFTTVDFVEDAPAAPVLFDHFVDSGVLLHRTGFFDRAVPYWYRFTNESQGAGQHLHDAGGLSSADPQAFRFLIQIHAFAYLPLTNDGTAIVALFREGVLLSNVYFIYNQVGVPRGIYSTESFDEVRFAGNLYLDNIYFSTIPAPGALAVAALTVPILRRRRR